MQTEDLHNQFIVISTDLDLGPTILDQSLFGTGSLIVDIVTTVPPGSLGVHYKSCWSPAKFDKGILTSGLDNVILHKVCQLDTTASNPGH